MYCACNQQNFGRNLKLALDKATTVTDARGLVFLFDHTGFTVSDVPERGDADV